MNLLEVWIKDAISIKDIEINGNTKIEVTFNTVCWGCKDVEKRIFDNIDEWEKFKSKKYYLA